MVAMRNSKEDTDQTIQALLDAALKVFGRDGYAAARLEDVAKEAGVTRGAIYRHFGSKPALFARLVEEPALTGSADLEEAVQAGGSPVEILRRALVATLRHIQADARFREVMALTLFHTGDSPELAALHRVRTGEQLIRVNEVFERAKVQGELRPDLDPQVAAHAFVAYQDGLVAAFLANPGSDVIRQAEQLAEVFIRGIGEWKRT
jgi:AcrR family transcriptional regulator